MRWLDGLSIRTLPLGLLDGAIKAGGDVRFEFVMYVLSKSRSSGFWSGVAPLNNVFLHAANQSMPADVQEIRRLGLVSNRTSEALCRSVASPPLRG